MTETTIDLPTVEECRALLDAINAERATGDLAPLETLDFDGAEPGRPHNCLSARNCYWPLGYYVGAETAFPQEGPYPRRVIPAEILRVTDVFDAAAAPYATDDDLTRLAALRARLVEAGVVKP